MKSYLLLKEAWPDMSFSLTWLPDVLKLAGLKVSEVPGWQNRGRGDVGRIFGVICHHTVGPNTENMPSLKTLIEGRPARAASPGHPARRALPGPLAQLGLARDGTYYVIAAGRANHAGPGKFQVNSNGSHQDITNGNSNFIGIEGENTGLQTDMPWPEVQMDAYRRGVAAILKHLRQGADFCIGHKEWASHRKIDPLFEMDSFRSTVATFMNGTARVPVPIPPVEPPSQPGGPLPRPTLRRGMTGELTRQVQAIIGVTVDGNFGPGTEAAVRRFQREHKLVPDGIVGPETWRVLDSVAAFKATIT
jgi:peptidoglycan hydrolase-like protein with peptidoglycan-binding domain